MPVLVLAVLLLAPVLELQQRWLLDFQAAVNLSDLVVAQRGPKEEEEVVLDLLLVLGLKHLDDEAFG